MIILLHLYKQWVRRMAKKVEVYNQFSNHLYKYKIYNHLKFCGMYSNN
jgi:hypothetical protein